jgi:hypothetical protein
MYIDTTGSVERAAVGHHERLLEQLEVADRRDDRHEQDRRAEQRHGHVAEGLPAPGAIDRGRLVELARDRLQPAMNTTIAKPEVPPDGHRDDRRHRQRGLASQSGPEKPTERRIVLISPTSGFRRNRQTTAIATMLVMTGR